MSFQRCRYRRHPWKGVQTLHTQAAAAACETEWAPHRDRYRRHSRKGVQAPRTRIEVEKAFTAFGTDDARERGYMPHPLKQRKIVKLNERPARSVLSTLAEGGIAPRTQAGRGCETQRASRVVGIEDSPGWGYRPHSLKQRLKKRPRGVRNMTTPAEGDTGPTH